MFQVVNRRGEAIALDESERSLPEPENSRRVASFAIGPCPVAAAAWTLANQAPAASPSPSGRQAAWEAPARTRAKHALNRLIAEGMNLLRRGEFALRFYRRKAL